MRRKLLMVGMVRKTKFDGGNNESHFALRMDVQNHGGRAAQPF